MPIPLPLSQSKRRDEEKALCASYEEDERLRDMQSSLASIASKIDSVLCVQSMREQSKR